MAVNVGRKIVQKTNQMVVEGLLGQALGILGNDPNSVKYILKAVDLVDADDDSTRQIINKWFEDGKPGREFIGRILKNTNPNVRRKFIARLMVNMFMKDHDREQAYVSKYGLEPPTVMLISPSMRCNYRCQGCYAGSYERKDDMKPEVFDRLLTEAENIGTNFFTILGGEPFIYP